MPPFVPVTAASGPDVPGSYCGSFESSFFQASRIGSTIDHAASTSSLRANSVASPTHEMWLDRRYAPEAEETAGVREVPTAYIHKLSDGDWAQRGLGRQEARWPLDGIAFLVAQCAELEEDCYVR